jgi:hypothetical protein
MTAVLQEVDYLADPALVVLPLDVVAAEPTPLYDETVQVRTGTPAPDWTPGARVMCAECGRTLAARRDWVPVRHKRDGVRCPGSDREGQQSPG